MSPQRKNHILKTVGSLGLVAGLLASAPTLSAINILNNPSFEANSGGVVPTGWTMYGPMSAGSASWVNTDAYAHSGNAYWKEWGATWNGAGDVAGIYQDKACAAGWTYAGDGWFFTLSTDAMGAGNQAWVEVSFRDASDNILGLYKTDQFASSVGLSTWFHYFVTNACDVTAPYAVTGSVSQLVAPAGTAKVRYQFVHLHNAWDGGAVYFDDANLDQLVGPVPPVLSNIKPGYMIMYVPTNGISFDVTSPSGSTIPNSGIHLTVNGADVTGSLNITGTASSKHVAYLGLQSNLNYTASITVTDAFNLSASSDMSFDTINQPVFLWEAEDYDFTNGLYINNPALSATNDNPNAYFGKVGTANVDFHDVSGGNGDHFYRAGDAMATTYSGDWNRQKFADANVPDYKIGWFNGGEWVNHTRNFPSGNYNIIARIAGGSGAATVTLSNVTTGLELGVFSFTGRGWSTYDYVKLTDRNGNLQAVTLGGVQTLQTITGGGADITFFMLIPAELDLPVLGSIYPDGAHPFELTNTLAFSVSSPNAAINTSDIHLMLNGNDVSAGLVVGGTSTARTATWTGLQPNAIYTAIVAVTNVNGKGILFSNRFDTFSLTNYMVEAEDYDYDGGQFVPAASYYNGAYAGLGAVTNVDYSHTWQNGEQFGYRGAGIPEEATGDYPRPGVALDFNLGWFGYPDWANYTREYPAGNYVVYGRLAGSGGYTMYLDQVVSGQGTTSQVTKRLGRWGAVGNGWQSYAWVPLTDEGLAAPTIVSLTGLSTLRIATTGNCNPNYFMLVPAAGITVSASFSSGNVNLSFPTIAGLSYRVFYRDEAASGNWTLLTTVAGDGTVKTATDTPTAAKRFYRVTGP